MNGLWLSLQSHSALAKRLLRKRRVNVMKGLCNSYTRSARGNAPSAVWERLGPKDSTRPVALVRGQRLQSLVAGNYEPRKQPWAAPTLASDCRRVLADHLNLMLK